MLFLSLIKWDRVSREKLSRLRKGDKFFVWVIVVRRIMIGVDFVIARVSLVDFCLEMRDNGLF